MEYLPEVVHRDLVLAEHPVYRRPLHNHYCGLVEFVAFRKGQALINTFFAAVPLLGGSCSLE
jgi:hypothetical protein